MTEKMKFETKNLTQENIAKIGQLFPEVLTEAKDKNGNLIYAIDFNKLKQILADSAVEGGETYDFTWVGKKQAILEAATPIRKTLRPCKEESVNWDTTQNLYIEGDNLEVLKLLQTGYLDKVKMIYIDPPYNTGNDFIYKDNFAQTQEEYAEQAERLDEEGNRLVKNTDSNGRFHSNWCSMMYPRLKLARNLLANDGIIFISIDEKEYHNLRKICDEIFDAKNYMGDLIWEATTQPINAGEAKWGLQKKTETILLYTKNRSKFLGFKLEENIKPCLYPHKGQFGPCRFEIIEKSDAGGYNRPSMKFTILGQYPRKGKRWQIGEETARLLEKEGKVEIVDGIVKRAIYPEDEKNKGSYNPFWSLLTANLVGTAQTGKDELNKILGITTGFDTVKPTQLIKKLLSHLGSDYYILDFFSGSGTTGHAVMALNAEDGGNRKFIMVQLPELIYTVDRNGKEVPKKGSEEAYKAGYKNICEIGKERIRRAAKKLQEEYPNAHFDGGFRVFKLADSNMKDVYYSPADYSQELLDKMTSNIKEDRTDMDLLYGCMLEWGLPLSYPHTTETVASFTIHTVNNGDLVACFDDNITEDIIRHIAAKKPLRVVLKDAAFTTSQEKINFGELFKLLSPDTKVKVI